MAQTFFQQLNIYLKGGQTLSIPFNAESGSKLNTQIETFVKAMGDKENAQKNFVFQGQRLVLVHLPDVSAIDVVSLVRKEEEKPAQGE